MCPTHSFDARTPEGSKRAYKSESWLSLRRPLTISSPQIRLRAYGPLSQDSAFRKVRLRFADKGDAGLVDEADLLLVIDAEDV